MSNAFSILIREHDYTNPEPAGKPDLFADFHIVLFVERSFPVNHRIFLKARVHYECIVFICQLKFILKSKFPRHTWTVTKKINFLKLYLRSGGENKPPYFRSLRAPVPTVIVTMPAYRVHRDNARRAGPILFFPHFWNAANDPRTRFVNADRPPRIVRENPSNRTEFSDRPFSEIIDVFLKLGGWCPPPHPVGALTFV